MAERNFSFERQIRIQDIARLIDHALILGTILYLKEACEKTAEPPKTNLEILSFLIGSLDIPPFYTNWIQQTKTQAEAYVAERGTTIDEELLGRGFGWLLFQ